MGRSYCAMLALAIVAVLQTAYYYPQLPNIVASHFDGVGRANDWSSKNTFFLLYLAMIALIFSIFWGLPLLTQHTSTSLINLPNKHYWLAEGRRESTLRFFQQQMGWFGVATLLMAISVMQLAINTNLNATRYLPGRSFWMILAVYFLYVIGWLIRFYARFGRTS